MFKLSKINSGFIKVVLLYGSIAYCISFFIVTVVAFLFMFLIGYVGP
jgi:hypothetical protein